MSQEPIEFKNAEVTRLLVEIQKRVRDMKVVMKAVGEEGIASIEENFKAEGRYSVVGDYIGGNNKWKPLSPVTEKIKEKQRKKKPFSILQDSGRLADSITAKATKDSVTIGTNVEYAAIHNFGAKKGEFGIAVQRINEHYRTSKKGTKYKVKSHERRVKNPMGDIPARPFMTIHPDNIDNMIEMLTDYLIDLDK